MARNSPKVALTGGGGLLGTAFSRGLTKRNWTGHLLDWRIGLQKPPSEIASEMASAGAEIIVHCAANTNVELCETEPAIAYRDNCFLAEVFATASHLAGAKFVLVSSTGVYGEGQDEAWVETDKPEPTTHHHKAKYLAEQACALAAPGALIVRTGWLYGGASSGIRDFVTNRLLEARSKDEISSDAGQFGNPTYTSDVVETTLTLVAGGYSGVFNCVNSGRASRYDYVSEILAIAGEKTPVRPVPSASFARVAPVSHNEVADCAKLKALGVPVLRDWRDALGSYIRSEL